MFRIRAIIENSAHIIRNLNSESDPVGFPVPDSFPDDQMILPVEPGNSVIARNSAGEQCLRPGVFPYQVIQFPVQNGLMHGFKFIDTGFLLFRHRAYDTDGKRLADRLKSGIGKRRQSDPVTRPFAEHVRDSPGHISVVIRASGYDLFQRIVAENFNADRIAGQRGRHPLNADILPRNQCQL